MKPLAIVGMSLVSPLGFSPSEHVFFARAGVAPQTSGAFRDAKGEPIPTSSCGWLGATLPVADRLAGLGRAACDAALEPWRQKFARRHSRAAQAPGALFVVSAAPRKGLSESDSIAFERAAENAAGGRRCVRHTGSAGFFQALVDAAQFLERRAERAAVIVAADTFLALEVLADWHLSGTTPWDADLPRPGEGAAGLLVMLPEEARQEGLEVLATIHSSDTRMGVANDDNEEVVDGAAMTELLRCLPGLDGSLGASFGPHGVGSLRRREWEYAAAREAGRFSPKCAYMCLESKAGCLGAAGGAAALVYGAAMHRHGAWPGEPREAAPFVAWAISRDGMRGLCTAKVGG